MLPGLLLLTPNAFAVTYFLDSELGDDKNVGSTEQQPWKSVRRANSAKLNPGDSVLFRRGRVWRHGIKAQGGAPSRPVVYGAYGNGAKPQIRQSFRVNNADQWIEVEEHLWKLKRSFRKHRAPGFFFTDSEVFARRELKRADLDSNMEFWVAAVSSAPVVHVYCTQNPAVKYPQLEATRDASSISVGKYNSKKATGHIVIEFLHLAYAGAHGINLRNNSHDITIRDSHVSFAGGSAYRSKNARGWARYGEPINIQRNAWNITVTRNVLEEGYDACIGLQGHRKGFLQRNIQIVGNVIQRCHYGIAFWQNHPTSTIENLLVRRNQFKHIGFGFSNGSRPTSQGGSASIKNFALNGVTRRIRIIENQFYESRGTLIEVAASSKRADMSIDRNTYFKLDADAPWWQVRKGSSRNIRNWQKFSPKEFAEWKASTRWDRQSVVADPSSLMADPAPSSR